MSVPKFKRQFRHGAKGLDVLAVKRALRRLYPGKGVSLSHKFGWKAVAGLKEFQKSQGLAADGVYGPKTHAKLAPHFDKFSDWLYNHARVPKKQSKRQVAVNFCEDSLAYAGRMVYTEGPGRSELFNRAPGHFLGAGADCSQFVSAIMHWSGIENVTDEYATGELLAVGKEVSTPALGRLLIAGPGAGVHVGMYVGKDDHGVWEIVEFGQQAAPDKITEPNFLSYFHSHGVFEFRIRDFFE